MLELSLEEWNIGLFLVGILDVSNVTLSEHSVRRHTHLSLTKTHQTKHDIWLPVLKTH